MIQGAHFAKPRYLGLLLISSLAVNVLALALPLMTMQVYDRILSNHAQDTLLVLSTGVIIAAIMEFVLRVCRSVVVGLNGAHFEHEAATCMTTKLLEAEPRSYAGNSVPMLMQDIGAAAKLKDYYGGQMMVTLLVDAPFTLFFLGLIAYLGGWLVLVPMVVLLMFGALSWREGKKLRQLMDKREQQDDARYSFITQVLQVVHSVKALCLEATMARRFEEVQRQSGQINYNVAMSGGRVSSLSYGFAQLMTVAMLCAGAPLAVYGHLSVGVLIASVLLAGQVMQPLQRGLAMWIRLQEIGLAKERLQGLLRLPDRPFIALDNLNANQGRIKIENLRFAYTEGQPVLDGAELDIAPGDAISIVGAPGAGKTTLLELLAGIYAPDRGRVQLSGMEIAHLPVTERARYLAYLPMNGLIMRGSIMDNLTGFNAQLRAQAREVADHLGIEESVALLPSGYDTPLEGHSTDVVPPGLKQRISIARALLYKPRLILFDNADHGTDAESYSQIFSLFARLKGKATMVIVSEDKNIVSLADHVYELRSGLLVKTMAPISVLLDRRIVRGVV